MRVRVKICGITRREDALRAVELGVDALGFVFWPKSPRAITPDQAAEITAALPPFVTRVGVFVDPPLDQIQKIVETVGLDAVQLHGSESPEFCAAVRWARVIKAFRIRDRASLETLPHYRTSAWLLDAFHEAAPGGTGRRFDWTLAQEAVALGRPVILAGGLTPENISEAILQVRPYGVDVSSGVEEAPGRKDPERMARFLAAVRTAEEQLNSSPL